MALQLSRSTIGSNSNGVTTNRKGLLVNQIINNEATDGKKLDMGISNVLRKKYQGNWKNIYNLVIND